MKVILIVLGALFALGLCLVGSCVFLFSRLLGPPAKAADEFIAELSAKDYRAAYDSADQVVKSNFAFERFTESIKALQMDQITVAKWHSTHITPPSAKCAGVAEMKDGSTVQIEISLTQSDQWRVSNMSLKGKSLVSPVMPGAVDRSTAVALALKTMIQWDRAIKAKDFTNFYANIANLWKQQTNPAELKQAFAKFIELEADIAGIADTEPAFEQQPAVTEDGILKMAGYYPTTPLKVRFELSYITEVGEWKLIHINVRMEPD